MRVLLGFSLTDVISINDFSRGDIDFVLKHAARMEAMKREEKRGLLSGRVVACLFFEPSTRTRLSFETAAHNVGGNVIGFADPNVSSVAKGETLSDTIKTIESYADIIVMRHPRDGSARRAADISKKPVINAGDGSNQHPTQTLMDLYTIQKEFGKIDGLNIGMVGDLKYGRVVHSLAVALSYYNNINLFFVSPEDLAMPRDIKEKIKGKVRVRESSKLEDFLPELDVLYSTRIQKERFADPMEYERAKNVYILGKEILEKTREKFRIMHALPRVNEIKTELDETGAALYFVQAANGLPTREALIDILKDVKK